MSYHFLVFLILKNAQFFKSKKLYIYIQRITQGYKKERNMTTPITEQPKVQVKGYAQANTGVVINPTGE